MDVVDPEDNPEVVPQPVVDPVTGDDGITDTSAKVRFSLPAEINTNGPVDRLVDGSGSFHVLLRTASLVLHNLIPGNT